MESNNVVENPENIRIRVPKRVLHFSDGVVEEFSDDEIDNTTKDSDDSLVDPKTLTWGPWMKHRAWSVGTTTVAACDYVGESLASFFGITTPKYQLEIEEYQRMEKKKKEEENAKKGWSEPADGVQSPEVPKDTQPEPVFV